MKTSNIFSRARPARRSRRDTKYVHHPDARARAARCLVLLSLNLFPPRSQAQKPLGAAAFEELYDFFAARGGGIGGGGGGDDDGGAALAALQARVVGMCDGSIMDACEVVFAIQARRARAFWGLPPPFL